MARTTAATQRDLMVTTLKATQPTSIQNVIFRHHDQRGDFREFCEKAKLASFRLFAIHDVGNVSPPEVLDAVQSWHETEFEVTVAYPNDWRYGSQLRLDQDDVLWEDLNLIDDTIGTAGFATFGDANVSLLSKGAEPGGAVTFGVLRYRIGFWRAVS